MRYENALLIDAPLAVVWDLTLDIERWPELTPTMRRVEPLDPGPLAIGSRAKVEQPMQPAAVWTVAELEPQRRFVWRTERSGLVMTAKHVLEEVDGGCRNTLALEVSGKGARAFTVFLGAAVRWSIRKENEGFKRGAERR